MLRSFVSLCLGVWLILQAGVQPSAAATSVLPIRVDYPLIRSFFIRQAFTDPGETAVIIDENDGCQFLKLQHPDLYSENGSLRLKSQMTLKMGLSVLDNCSMPIELEGLIDVRLKVHLDLAGWKLHFRADDVRFSTLDGKPSILSAKVVDMVTQRLFDHLDQVTINLATPIQELQQTLPLFVQPEAQAKISKWLQSIRPGKIEARPEFFSIELIMDVETNPPGALPAPPEKRLSAEEMERFTRSWEIWDSFLVYQIDRLGLLGLDDQERALVLQTLLETRYQLAAVLASDQTDQGKDLVRTQFLTVWERFSPLFRKYLVRDPAIEPLSFLIFLSAGDALAALDTLGPTLGLDISREGLIRLARLLAAGGTQPVKLDYTFEVDPALRNSLGFGPPLSVPDQLFHEEEVPPPGGGTEEEIKLLHPTTWLHFSPRSAFAAELPPAGRQALKAWIVDRSNFATYLPMVRSLLHEETGHVVASGKLTSDRSELFERIMNATAWQESCFRQFVVKGGKMTYLRSWNNTSVGLMQINERVWRGLYRADALRWAPKYNIQAGSEILRMYLSDYVLKVPPGTLKNEDDLARATYALYNSGPQNFKGFLKHHAQRHYLQLDALFWQKYNWTKDNEFDRLKECLFDE
jgi:hypothetical protein